MISARLPRLPLTRKLQTLAGLSWSERLLTLEVAARLVYYEIGLRTAKPARWMKAPAAARTSSASPLEIAAVRRAVLRASRNIPGGTKCLPQALAARAMLARRGVTAELKIAARSAPSQADRFHAWLEYEGMQVTGVCDDSEYRVFGYTSN
ncbi:lasso peptide biosynthesis B2 protein [Qipengyuania atrilutea]|uniref:Lasso peptide biosynthesis B2 protein n=1 Tax=Qipengyuania atrilutea TaxID=2744473 RepID=A0A850GVM5_9SPHN|nr:lasso peptide biosynthesis B2 protein [Actirhodobacter atriluteus]NVD43551.1 lasso peptide biosynthesis B2 protein [Actirhodobacter atriluteus]